MKVRFQFSILVSWRGATELRPSPGIRLDEILLFLKLNDVNSNMFWTQRSESRLLAGVTKRVLDHTTGSLWQ